MKMTVNEVTEAAGDQLCEQLQSRDYARALCKTAALQTFMLQLVQPLPFRCYISARHNRSCRGVYYARCTPADLQMLPPCSTLRTLCSCTGRCPHRLGSDGLLTGVKLILERREQLPDIEPLAAAKYAETAVTTVLRYI